MEIWTRTRTRTNTWISSKAIFFLSNFLCVSFFALILPYTCPTFFSRMRWPCTAESLLVPLGSCFPIFMMNWDFWGLQHCSRQSFINKCNCAKQVSLINEEVTVALSESFSRLTQTILRFPKFFLESSASISSSKARQAPHPWLTNL